MTISGMRFLHLAAFLLLPLTACSSLPKVAPDSAPATTPTQVEGPRGPLPASRSREILAGLERGADDTGIFDRHLAVEQRCRTVYDSVEKPDGYQVRYRLGDHEGSVRMDHDPGNSIPVENGELVLNDDTARR